jgi:hypothetical protein
MASVGPSSIPSVPEEPAQKGNIEDAGGPANQPSSLLHHRPMKRINLVLYFLLSAAVMARGGQDMQARFKKSLEAARSISAIEIRFLDTMWAKDAPPGAHSPFWRTYKYSFTLSGLKYRAECEPISGSQTNLQNSRSTFNGHDFSFCYVDQRYLVLKAFAPTNDTSLSPENPLVAPFRFLTRQSDDCRTCILSFRDIRNPDFCRAEALPEATRSGGALEFTLPGLPLAKQPTLWKVVMDERGDSFTPKAVHRVLPGLKQELVYNLLDYTNLSGYWFPRTVTWICRSTSSPTTLFMTGIVTVVSASIPEHLDDSIFEVDESHARTVWDATQHMFISPAQR